MCLCLLAKADPALARDTTESGNGNLVRRLGEYSHNILKGNVSLKNNQKGRLGRYKKDLRALVKRKTALHERKRVLQKGGFVGHASLPLVSYLVHHVQCGCNTAYVYLSKLAAPVRAVRFCLFSPRDSGSVGISYSASVDDVVGLRVVGTLHYDKSPHQLKV